MRFVQLSWITTRPGRAWVGSMSNKHNPSAKSGLQACISSRIATVIHVLSDHQINYNCFNEPFAVSPYTNLYWDMHGLIFETSIWLLAGSTRFVRNRCAQQRLLPVTYCKSQRATRIVSWRRHINDELSQIFGGLPLTNGGDVVAANQEFGKAPQSPQCASIDAGHVLCEKTAQK